MYWHTLAHTHTTQRSMNLLGRLPGQWVSAVSCLGSTKSHLESASDSQSIGETRIFSGFHDCSWYFWKTAFDMNLVCFSLITSCFCSRPSWFRSNRLKTSSVLRESSGWFDSSCPWLGPVVWLPIRPFSWASCTTTRHSSSDRKPGISDRNRKNASVVNVRIHCTFLFPLQIIWSLWGEKKKTLLLIL